MPIGGHHVRWRLAALSAAAFVVLISPGFASASTCHPGQRPTSPSPLALIFGPADPQPGEAPGRPKAPSVAPSCPRDDDGGPSVDSPWGQIAADLDRACYQPPGHGRWAPPADPDSVPLRAASPPERPPRRA
ncbi:MAG: hypothetical protein U0800_21400 [Isosphaeraceae bacterium]